MRVVEVITTDQKTRYYLEDDEGTTVEPVLQYLKFRDNAGYIHRICCGQQIYIHEAYSKDKVLRSRNNDHKEELPFCLPKGVCSFPDVETTSEFRMSYKVEALHQELCGSKINEHRTVRLRLFYLRRICNCSLQVSAKFFL